MGKALPSHSQKKIVYFDIGKGHKSKHISIYYSSFDYFHLIFIATFTYLNMKSILQSK
jgi:hypothetical protein